jgi:hypothetical protein
MTDNKKLLNQRDLARELGVSSVFVKRMKYAGFAMPGGRSTVEWALQWLQKNPDFKQKDHLKPSQDLERPQERACDK